MDKTYRMKNRQATYQNYAKVVSNVNVLRNAIKVLRNTTSFERKTKTRQQHSGAGATFDLTFFNNSKVIDFDDQKVSFLRKKSS